MSCTSIAAPVLVICTCKDGGVYRAGEKGYAQNVERDSNCAMNSPAYLPCFCFLTLFDLLYI